MSAPGALERPLGMFEWSMWLTERGVTTNCMVLADVLGPLDDQALREALAWTQAKHPALRARIGLVAGRPRLLPCHGAVSLRVAEGDWRAEAVRELRTPMDAAGPLARCTLVRQEPGRATLILAFSHVVVDGYSMMAVLDDVSRAASGILSGQPPAAASSPAGAPLEARLPAWARGLAVVPRVARFLAREQLGVMRGGAPRRFARHEPEPEERRPDLLPRPFDEALTARLVGASSEHGVPVQCALGAAQLLGVADEIAAGAAVPLWLGSSVNLRADLSPPVTRPDELGLFVSLVGSRLSVDRRRSLWELAAALKSDQAARLARGEPFLTFPLGSRTFSAVRRWLPASADGGLRFVRMMRKMFPGGTALSNLGRVAVGPPDGAPLRLERVQFAAADAVMPLGSMSVTFRGRLHWNFVSCVGDQGARVADRIVERLRDALAARRSIGPVAAAGRAGGARATTD